MKATYSLKTTGRLLQLAAGVFLTLMVAVSARAANTTHTWSAGSTNWSAVGSPGWDTTANAAGDIMQYNTATTASFTTNDVAATVGQLQIGTVASAGNWTVVSNTANSLTLDGTGINGSQVFGNAGVAAIVSRMASGSGGALTNNVNVSIANSDLDIGVTSGGGTVVINGNITATSAHNLTFRGAGSGLVTIAGSIGASGSAITITNARGSGGGVVISGVLGANVASVTENSSSSALTLSGANTYSGGTTLSAGTLNVITSGTVLGSGNLTLAGGTFAGFGVTIANNIVAQNGSTTTIQLSGAGDLNLNGNLSGGGNINAQYGAGSGTHAINLGGTNNNFTGTFTAANNSSIRYNFNSTNSGSSNAVWVLNNSSPGNNSGIGFGLGTGMLYFGALSGNGGMRGTATLNIGGLNTNATWSGNISANNGAISVVKSGTGTETFSANNAYNGTTEIRNGTLTINSTLPSSAVTVDAADGNAALGGTGTLSQRVTLTNAAAFTASINLTNGSAGTLTLSGGLTLSTNTALLFDVANAASDQIAVTGAVNLPTSGTVTVKLNNIGVTGVVTNKLISVTSGTVAMDATKFTLATTAPSGFNWQLQNDADGFSLDLVIAPSAIATGFWNGSVNNSWSSAGNWSADAAGTTPAGGIPGVGTAVIFAINSVGSANTTLGGNFEIGSLEFNSPVGVTNGGANTLTNDGALMLDSTSGKVTINPSSYVLGGDEIISNSSSSTLTIGSPVSGAHAVIVNSSGSGVTTLAGNNSYTGGTTVAAGTLVLSGNNTSATGATTVSSALQLQNANALAGSALTLNNGSTLQLHADANATFTNASLAMPANGATFNFDVNQISSGSAQTLTLANGLALGTGTPTINVTGGNSYTLGLGAVSQGDATGLTLNVAAGANLNVAGYSAGVLNGNNQTLTFSGNGNITIGAITSTSPLANGGRDIYPVFNQSGTVTLTGTNNFFQGLNRAGNVFAINNGTLVIANSSALNVATLGTSTSFTFGSTTATANNVNFLLGAAGSGGGLTTGTSANKINSFTVQDNDGGTITLGGQNTSGVNTFSGNFTLGASGGKSVTLIAATGGEVDFTGNLLANGGDTTAGITVGDGSHAGTVKLTGLNTYQGGSIVSSGTLALSSLTGTASNSSLTVNDGATLQVIVSGANQLSPATLTFGSSGAVTNSFSGVASTAGAPVNAGSLVVNGALVINIASGNFAVGQSYPLIAYTGETISGSVALGSLPLGINATLTDNGSGLIYLTVNSVSPEIWTGAANGTWTVGGPLNWSFASLTTNYSDGSTVLFDDTATGTTAITNIASVSPGGITVSNSAKLYSFVGGAIGGSASLTKDGSGTLILASANTYNGGTVIANGTLQLGDGTANMGVIAGNVTDNGVLSFNTSADQTFAGIISGTGSVTKTNANTLSLTGVNTFTNGLVVKAGKVYSSNPVGFESAVTGFGVSTNPVTLGDTGSSADATIEIGGAWVSMSQPVTVVGSGSRLLRGTWNNGGQVQNFGSITLASADVRLQQTSLSPLRYLTSVITGTGNVIVTNTSSGFTDLRSSVNNAGYVRNDSTGSGGIDNQANANTFGANVTSLIQNSATAGWVLRQADAGFAGTVQVLQGSMYVVNGTALNANNAVSVASGATLDIQNVNETIAGLNDVSGAGGTVTDSTGASLHTLTLGGSGNYSFSGTLTAATNANRALTVNLSAGGTQKLSGVSTYTGNTTISAGTLLVNGSLDAGSAVTVNGGTLGGNGTINGAATVNANAFLDAGNGGIGTLTFSNNLTLNAASTNDFVVTTGGGSSNKVVVAGLLTPNGSVVHITAGAALGAGTNRLFTYGTISGAFSSTPLFDVAQALSGSIVDDGSGHINLVMASVGLPSPAHLTNSLVGSTLTLTWPSGQGWRLVSQTNNLITGINTNVSAWHDVPGVSGGSATLTVDPAKPTVFYELINP